MPLSVDKCSLVGPFWGPFLLAMVWPGDFVPCLVGCCFLLIQGLADLESHDLEGSGGGVPWTRCIFPLP